MITSIIIAAATCLLLIVAVLTKSRVKIGDFKLDIYPFVPVLGAICVICFKTIGIKDIVEKFTSSSSSNPVKIIVLFISMSLLSVLLDESGFFEYIAEKIAQKAGNSQKRIFIAIYLTVSLLTIFTSNDVVILTFTPSICQFCKKAEINSLPYVVSEFVAANTWSLLFLIGNPTNVFLSQAYGVTFGDYFLRMWLPTVFCGVSSFVCLYLIFRKKLQKPAYRSINEVKLKDKPVATIDCAFLCACTALIAVASYIHLEMWYVALIMTTIAYFVVIIYKLVVHQTETIVKRSFLRAPWQMLPLVLGMFVVILSLVSTGATSVICNYIGSSFPIIKYGVTSTLLSNLTNNIPMSVLFSSVTSEITEPIVMQKAVYATIIGSNIGAFLTPLGALAGLMFTNIVKRYDKGFGFVSFIGYGATVASVSLVFGLIGLYLSFLLS